MIRKDIPVINRLGLHARAAAKLVTLASEFSSAIQLERDNKRVNGKSIMGVMMLAAGQGVTLRVIVDGPDEQEAMESIENLFRQRFGENE
ncbi:MAG TPA: HPr family phosphocarrier protein [Gammaproteobacteria bacterium]|nr:HPr family phosphocarrier protein [Gammaproteobacteria bacterium]